MNPVRPGHDPGTGRSHEELHAPPAPRHSRSRISGRGPGLGNRPPQRNAIPVWSPSSSVDLDNFSRWRSGRAARGRSHRSPFAGKERWNGFTLFNGSSVTTHQFPASRCFAWSSSRGKVRPTRAAAERRERNANNRFPIAARCRPQPALAVPRSLLPFPAPFPAKTNTWNLALPTAYSLMLISNSFHAPTTACLPGFAPRPPRNSSWDGTCRAFFRPPE